VFVGDVRRPDLLESAIELKGKKLDSVLITKENLNQAERYSDLK
jgi:hypothetical protein